MPVTISSRLDFLKFLIRFSALSNDVIPMVDRWRKSARTLNCAPLRRPTIGELPPRRCRSELYEMNEVNEWGAVRGPGILYEFLPRTSSNPPLTYVFAEITSLKLASYEVVVRWIFFGLLLLTSSSPLFCMKVFRLLILIHRLCAHYNNHLRP